MLLRNDQNPEAFFEALARHLAPGKGWKRLMSAEGDEVVFGSGYWKASVTYKEIDGISTLSGAEIESEEYNEEDIRMIEYVIGLLEGIEYEEQEADKTD